MSTVLPHPQGATVPSLPKEGERQKFYQSLTPFVWTLRFRYVVPDKGGKTTTHTQMETHQTAFAVGDGLIMTSSHGDWDKFLQLKVTGKPLSSSDDLFYDVVIIQKKSRCDMCLLGVKSCGSMTYPKFGSGKIEVTEPLMVIGHPLDYPGSGMWGTSVYECVGEGENSGFRLGDKLTCNKYPRPNMMGKPPRHRVMGNVFNKEFFERANLDPNLVSEFDFQKRLLARLPIIQATGIMAGKGASGAPVFNLKGEIVGMHLYRVENFEIILHCEALKALAVDWVNKNPGRLADVMKLSSTEKEEGSSSKGKGKGKELKKRLKTMDRKRSFDQMEDSSVVVAYEFSESEKCSLRESVEDQEKFRGLDELDITTKKSALKASAFVVSLISFSGESLLSQGCGTIIENYGNINLVLTSLTLIREPIDLEESDRYVRNALADNVKVIICSSDKNSYEAEILCYDYHYNLLVLKFKSNGMLSSAKQALIAESVNNNNTSFMMHPHSTTVKSGDPVIIVGRYFWDNYDLMAASGTFSMECASPNFFDCIELLTSSCNITKSGEGAPVINLSGEVFGIAYYECGRSSVFLPMQVANMWWEHYKQHKEMRHLAYGFEGGCLYSAMLPFLETFSANFPRINDGVRVTNVLPESFAESAGLLENDFILKCDGKSVKSFLELWGLMWDKVGDAVELQVARLGLDAIQIIRMAVGEADEFNKWPRYDY